MPKIKSHRGAAKRFLRTGRGKIKHKRPQMRHLLIGMSSNRGRRLRKAGYLNRTDSAVIKALLPYGSN